MQGIHSSSSEIDFPCDEKYGMNDNLASQAWDLDIPIRIVQPDAFMSR